MPKRNAVEQLPTSVKAWLDKALIDSNFSGYKQLEEELKSRGYSIGKSSINRYGQAFEERLLALKMASQQAKAIVEAAPDDEGAVSEALMRLIQEKLFQALLAAEIDTNKANSLNLGSAAKAIAGLTRATVTQKKWQQELREKAKAAAEDVGKQARKGGLSEEAIRAIEETVLGIAR